MKFILVSEYSFYDRDWVLVDQFLIHEDEKDNYKTSSRVKYSFKVVTVKPRRNGRK